MRQQADIIVLMPECQRFWEWRIEWLAVGASGGVVKIANAGESVAALGGGVLHVEKDGGLFDVEFGRLHREDEVSAHAGKVATKFLVAGGFGGVEVLILCGGLFSTLQVGRGLLEFGEAES